MEKTSSKETKAFAQRLASRYDHLRTISHSKREAGLNLEKERKQSFQGIFIKISVTLLVLLNKHCRCYTCFIEFLNKF